MWWNVAAPKCSVTFANVQYVLDFYDFSMFTYLYSASLPSLLSFLFLFLFLPLTPLLPFTQDHSIVLLSCLFRIPQVVAISMDYPRFSMHPSLNTHSLPICLLCLVLT